MAEKLKDRFFTRSSVGDMAKTIRGFYADFNNKRFLGFVFDNLVDERELKEKMHHTAMCLYKTLPAWDISRSTQRLSLPFARFLPETRRE